MTDKKFYWILAAIGGFMVLAAGAVKLGIDAVIERMAFAIQDFEGWFPGSRSYRNNNPGNLRWFGSTIPWEGATGLDESNHVIFESYEAGLEALKNQLWLAFTGRSRVYSPEDTLKTFFGKYAEANQDSYAAFVASKLNVSVDTKLKDLTFRG